MYVESSFFPLQARLSYNIITMLNYYHPGTVSRMQIKLLSERIHTYVKILSGSEKGVRTVSR